MDFNKKENKFNWELLFLELYAGGKYENNEDSNYEYSLGMNGLGLCATQYASEFMEAWIKRDGYLYRLNFKEGENIGGLVKERLKNNQTGTKIRWKPDSRVFTEIEIPDERLKEMVKRQAVINSNLTFNLKIQSQKSIEEFNFKYENGIHDYLIEISGETLIVPPQSFKIETTSQDRSDKPEYKLKIDVAMGFSDNLSQIEYYHNSSFLEHGGAPEKAVKASFVTQFDSLIRQMGKYVRNESKISFNDIKDNLVLIVSSFSNITSYENQTKKSITNKGIYDSMLNFFKHSLEVYFLENPAEAEKIALQILINKRSREDAEKTRINLKKNLSSNMDISSRVAKFVDCRTKDLNLRELFIVEGDSALGACKQARDANFQAIIPIRGKILNCLKANYSKILKSEIIIDLIKVLGCGAVLNKSEKKISSFNLNSLRWNKVILCTDADVDGFQIRTLILTMIYCLTPDLISAGKVFIAQTPLYEVTARSKTFFAYSESEKEEFLRKIGDEKFTIQRSKGLGENEPEMMNFTTMNPLTRRLIKIIPAEMQKTCEIFDVLLGENLDGRKRFIAEFGKLYLNQVDVS